MAVWGHVTPTEFASSPRRETFKEVFLRWILRLIDPTKASVQLIEAGDREPNDSRTEMAPGIVRPTSILIRLIGEEMMNRMEDVGSYTYSVIDHDGHVRGCVWKIEKPCFIEVHLNFFKIHEWYLARYKDKLLSELRNRIGMSKGSDYWPEVTIKYEDDIVELNDYEKMLMLRTMVELRRFKKKQVDNAVDFAAQKIALNAVETLLLSSDKGRVYTGQSKVSYETYTLQKLGLPSELIAIPTQGKTIRVLDHKPKPEPESHPDFHSEVCTASECINYRAENSKYCEYHKDYSRRTHKVPRPGHMDKEGEDLDSEEDDDFWHYD